VIRIAEVMSAPTLSVTPDTTVLEAARYLLQRDVVVLPVVAADGRLIGVVSRSDLLRHRLFSATGGPLVAAVREAGEPLPAVAEVMTSRVVTLPPDAELAQASDVMRRHRIRAVPVVDSGRLVGVISVTGLLQAQVPGEGPAAPDDVHVRSKPATGRPTDRRGLVVLTMDECLARLRSTPIGRFAFVVQGAPVVLPVNYGLDGTTVVFRTTWGSKLQIAQATERVAFEADGFDAATKSGWSVLVQGRAEAVYEEADAERYARLGVRTWAGVDRDTVWVRLRPDEISGRELPRTA
jgi:CBS domain-containing protein